MGIGGMFASASTRITAPRNARSSAPAVRSLTMLASCGPSVGLLIGRLRFGSRGRVRAQAGRPLGGSHAGVGGLDRVQPATGMFPNSRQQPFYVARVAAPNPLTTAGTGMEPGAMFGLVTQLQRGRSGRHDEERFRNSWQGPGQALAGMLRPIAGRIEISGPSAAMIPPTRRGSRRRHAGFGRTPRPARPRWTDSPSRSAGGEPAERWWRPASGAPPAPTVDTHNRESSREDP